ncbi:MAG: hypothetical protein ACI9XP_001353, partial [Lentimonas sp.]
KKLDGPNRHHVHFRDSFKHNCFSQLKTALLKTCKVSRAIRDNAF